MPVIRHQLLVKQVDIVRIQALRQNLLDGFVARRLVNDRVARVAPVQGMVQPARFVGS